jgi:uncharacterized protein YcbX
METVLATVSELWRYPVKSLAGESLEQAHIFTHGLGGDRSWALVDCDSGDITGAKQHPRLLQASASYEHYALQHWAYGDEVPPATVTLADGSHWSSDSAAASQQLSALAGKPLRLAPLQPPENRQHYRLAHATDEQAFLDMMGIEPGESVPDFADADPGLLALLADHATPPGRHADAFALHLLTTSSLEKLARHTQGASHARRFRPNLIVEPRVKRDEFVEFDWVGKQLRIGSTLLYVDSRTVRCSMPARAQPQYGLDAAPIVAKTLYQMTQRHFGVNITVLEGGKISHGDDVILID